jgi:hypothetical protein
MIELIIVNTVLNNVQVNMSKETDLESFLKGNNVKW